MQPTSNLDRIPMLDALRGFALCGILLANLLSFTGAVCITVDDLSHTDWLTRSMLFAIDFFVESQFLFGFWVGCYLFPQLHHNIWRQGRLRKFFDPLILLGRMSLTNYLGQSVIGILIFYGYGFSLMRETPFSLVPVIAGFILLLQWQSSKFWLQRYPHGPIETLWKWSTYVRFPATKSSFNHD